MRALIIVLVFAVLVLSCKENNRINEESLVTLDLVELDNGTLWSANEETTLGIDKMIGRMNSFSEKEDPIAYRILKDSLETDFTEIFQKCTMKGEAHNQLHNYLKPMIDLFDGLDSEDLEICKKSFKDLDRHLNGYKNFFE